MPCLLLLRSVGGLLRPSVAAIAATVATGCQQYDELKAAAALSSLSSPSFLPLPASITRMDATKKNWTGARLCDRLTTKSYHMNSYIRVRGCVWILNFPSASANPPHRLTPPPVNFAQRILAERRACSWARTNEIAPASFLPSWPPSLLPSLPLKFPRHVIMKKAASAGAGEGEGDQQKHPWRCHLRRRS